MVALLDLLYLCKLRRIQEKYLFQMYQKTDLIYMIISSLRGHVQSGFTKTEHQHPCLSSGKSNPCGLFTYSYLSVVYFGIFSSIQLVYIGHLLYIGNAPLR